MLMMVSILKVNNLGLNWKFLVKNLLQCVYYNLVVSSQTITAQIPDGVRNFILHFYRNVIDNNVYELHNIYDSSFNKLTEKYYQKQAWPEAEVIAPLVNDGKYRIWIWWMQCMIYSEQ